MQNPRYDGWSALLPAKVETSLPVALTTTETLVEIRVPRACLVRSLEMRLESITGAAAVSVTIYRDSSGEHVWKDLGALSVVTAGSAATGAAHGDVSKVFLPITSNEGAAVETSTSDTDLIGNVAVSLYVGIKTTAGTANLTSLLAAVSA